MEYLGSILGNIIRFFILAAGFYLLLWVFGFAKSRRIPQKGNPPPQPIYIEGIQSVFTMTVFAIAIVTSSKLGFGYYNDLHEFGLPYLFFSILALAFLTDTFFYWTHRLYHEDKFYWIHKLHHNSVNTTPWAAYALGISQATIMGLFIFALYYVFPWHPLAAITLSTFGILHNVIIHSGYELFPKWWIRLPITKWIITSTHHNIHHQEYRWNFGLYFMFWDNLMGTNHPDWKKTYEKITH